MIYLDHAATTYVYPAVKNEIMKWMQPDHVGNPGSIHTQGSNAFHAIEVARKQVADLINADPSEIYFTSGGTESNNTWIQCLKRHIIITTKLEHHSILEPVEHGIVSSAYVSPLFVDVDRTGRVKLEDLKRLLATNEGLVGAVSVMWVNNEFGTINPVEEIGLLCKKHNVIFHTDAVQAAGHTPIDVKKCHVDILSLSAHKFGGPLGVVVLYISSAIHKKPLILGGGQELGMRGGTQNVPGIVGTGLAAEITAKYIDSCMSRWKQLRDLFISIMGDKDNLYGQFQINGSKDHGTDNIISLTIPGVESESLLLLLDKEGICISAGSACSAGSSDPSHVLMGIGLSESYAASTVRISRGAETTEEEIKMAAEAIVRNAKRLKALYDV